MAFPLIPVVAGIAALLAAGTAAVKFWPDAKDKRLLVTGATATGKTTLAEFLTSGVIPARYVRTTSTKTHVAKEDFKLKQLGLKIGKVWDPAGDRDAWKAWLSKAKEADAILYLVDYARRDDDAYCQMVRRDAGQIALWRKQGDLPKQTPLVLVVTHCDVQPGFTPDGHEVLPVARECAPVREALRKLGGSTRLVAGSLKTQEHAAVVTCELLEAVGWASR